MEGPFNLDRIYAQQSTAIQLPFESANWGSVVPAFPSRTVDLFRGAQSVCRIAVLDKKGKTYSGTAFFVTETLLLTAGHLIPDGKRKIVAQKPGTSWGEIYLDALFEKNPPCDVIPCRFIGSGYSRVDLAALEVEGPFRADHIMEITQQNLQSGEAVDIIGYAGEISIQYIRKMHGGLPNRQDIDDVHGLFPIYRMLVSYGTIEATGNELTYAASTVIGMSGAPVVFQGQAIGMCLTNKI